MSRHRFLIVDDHPLIRVALRHVLESTYQNCEIKEVGALGEISRAVSNRAKPHLVILDLQIPGVHGFSGLLHARARCPKSPILIISETAEPATMRRALTLGASGFISKAYGDREIRAAVATVVSGKRWMPEDYDTTIADDDQVVNVARRLATLSPQQMRIFVMMREGLLNKQIAYDLGISETTVKAHVTSILQKLGATNRTHAVIVTNAIDRPLVQARKRVALPPAGEAEFADADCTAPAE